MAFLFFGPSNSTGHPKCRFRHSSGATVSSLRALRKEVSLCAIWQKDSLLSHPQSAQFNMFHFSYVIITDIYFFFNGWIVSNEPQHVEQP